MEFEAEWYFSWRRTSGWTQKSDQIDSSLLVHKAKCQSSKLWSHHKSDPALLFTITVWLLLLLFWGTNRLIIYSIDWVIVPCFYFLIFIYFPNRHHSFICFFLFFFVLYGLFLYLFFAFNLSLFFSLSSSSFLYLFFTYINFLDIFLVKFLFLLSINLSSFIFNYFYIYIINYWIIYDVKLQVVGENI